jgi:imidazolonepropionase-like amidohydrolase
MPDSHPRRSTWTRNAAVMVAADAEGPGHDTAEALMLAVRAGRAFDGERAIPGGALVLTDGGRIVGIEPGSADPPDGWSLVELPGATLLPGLIDTHVHLCGDSRMGALDRLPGYSDEELTGVIEQALAAQLAAGVTSVRDLGDRRWSALEWRDRMAADGVTGSPTIVASGPPITSPAGHCWQMGGEAHDAEELREAVRERADRRTDIVKVMASGGATTPGTDVLACQFQLDELRLVVEEAHALGLPVTAHAHGLPAVRQAISAGVDGIEHCGCLTASGMEVSDELLEALADRQIQVCPTLGRTGDAAPPPALAEIMARSGMTWEARLAIVGRMHRAGVQVVCGADAGIGSGKPHGILPEAVIDLVSAGLPPAAALASATSVAARACGLGERKGRLRAGYDADLLLVDGDPLTDITALRRVSTVVAGGSRVGGQAF